MKFSDIWSLPLNAEDRVLAEKICRGQLDGSNFCWCQRCQRLHIYTKWKGRMVMLGSCGAFISKP